MHKPPGTVSPAKPHRNEISFATLPQEEYTTAATPSSDEDSGAREGFAVGSEGGFFFADKQAKGGRVATGVCNVTGARGFLRFST